jgi:hypothetical protein
MSRWHDLHYSEHPARLMPEKREQRYCYDSNSPPQAVPL